MIEQPDDAVVAADDIFVPTLTVGVAWNGAGDPQPCMLAGTDAPCVAEILISPMDEETRRRALELAGTYPKIRVLPAGDTGIYSAWNKLVDACRTSHIVFHGVDDLIRNDPLYTRAFAALGPEEMLVSSVQFATPQGRLTAIYHHRETSPAAVMMGREANPAGPEVTHPLKVIRAVNGLDESFRIAGDVDLYFRVRRKAIRRDCEAVLLTMLDGGMSTTARHARTVWKENRRIARQNGQKVPTASLLAAALFLNGRNFLYRLGGEGFSNRITDAVRGLAGKPPRYSLAEAA